MLQLPCDTMDPVVVFNYQEIRLWKRHSLDLVVLRNVITERDSSILARSSFHIATKVTGLRSKNSENPSRQTVKSCCFGYWKRYATIVRPTANTKQAGHHFTNWVKQNENVWTAVDSVFCSLFPLLHSLYQQHIPEQYKVFKCWPSAFLNISDTRGMTGHFDTNDHNDGCCIIIPFGNFSGGDFFFRDLGLLVQAQPRSIIIFKSAQIFHGHNSFQGMRGTIVLFIHQAVLNSFW